MSYPTKNVTGVFVNGENVSHLIDPESIEIDWQFDRTKLYCGGSDYPNDVRVNGYHPKIKMKTTFIPKGEFEFDIDLNKGAEKIHFNRCMVDSSEDGELTLKAFVDNNGGVGRIDLKLDWTEKYFPTFLKWFKNLRRYWRKIKGEA